MDNKQTPGNGNGSQGGQNGGPKNDKTPRNGQIPKNLEKIKLFTKIAPRNNINKLIICPPPMRSSYSLIN